MPEIMWNNCGYPMSEATAESLLTLGVVTKTDDGAYVLANEEAMIANPHSIVQEGLSQYDRASLIFFMAQCFLSMEED